MNTSILLHIKGAEKMCVPPIRMVHPGTPLSSRGRTVCMEMPFLGATILYRSTKV